jgi:hypothetical protein
MVPQGQTRPLAAGRALQWTPVDAWGTRGPRHDSPSPASSLLNVQAA